jgi:Zn finger protein HypA/HybF involved in hydrogenase expression
MFRINDLMIEKQYKKLYCFSCGSLLKTTKVGLLKCENCNEFFLISKDEKFNNYSLENTINPNGFFEKKLLKIEED